MCVCVCVTHTHTHNTHTRTQVATQVLLAQLASTQSFIPENPDKKREDAGGTRKKKHQSLHSMIIQQAQFLLDADECYLLVRGAKGGPESDVRSMRDSLLAARWCRHSKDGSVVQGELTGEHRRPRVQYTVHRTCIRHAAYLCVRVF